MFHIHMYPILLTRFLIHYLSKYSTQEICYRVLAFISLPLLKYDITLRHPFLQAKWSLIFSLIRIKNIHQILTGYRAQSSNKVVFTLLERQDLCPLVHNSATKWQVGGVNFH